MLGIFEYSPREQELIAYFGFTDAMRFVAPMPLYRMMAEKAFIDNDQTCAATSLRRIIKEMGQGIKRMTPEWDALIEIPQPDRTVIECVSDAVARERIVAIFRNTPRFLYYDEIADRAMLSMTHTTTICNQMESDGLIEKVEGRGLIKTKT